MITENDFDELKAAISTIDELAGFIAWYSRLDPDSEFRTAETKSITVQDLLTRVVEAEEARDKHLVPF